MTERIASQHIGACMAKAVHTMTQYFAPLVVAVAALLSAGAVGAAEPSQDIGAMLGKLRGQVVKAEVLAGAVKWSFPRRMSEADLPRIGCLYHFDDPAAIASLMDTLAGAPIDYQGTAGAPLNVRLGVYLHAGDGTTTKLLFERTYQNGDARGNLNDSIPFVAKAPFDRHLRTLLAHLQPATVHYQCDRDDIPLVPTP